MRKHQSFFKPSSNAIIKFGDEDKKKKLNEMDGVVGNIKYPKRIAFGKFKIFRWFACRVRVSNWSAKRRDALVSNRIYQNDKSSRHSINAGNFIVLIHLIPIQLIAHGAATTIECWRLVRVGINEKAHTRAQHMSEWIMCGICFSVWESPISGIMHRVVYASHTHTPCHGRNGHIRTLAHKS